MAVETMLPHVVSPNVVNPGYNKLTNKVIFELPKGDALQKYGSHMVTVTTTLTKILVILTQIEIWQIQNLQLQSQPNLLWRYQQN